MSQQSPNIGWTEALGSHGGLPDKPCTSGFKLLSQDREWPVAQVNGPIRAAYEQWMRARAIRAYKDVERVDMEEGDKMRRVFLADMVSGSYNFDGRHGRTSRGDSAGISYLFFLLLRACDPEMTEQLAAKILEDTKPIKQVGDAIEWALGNSAAPATQAPSPGKTTTPERPAKEPPEPRTLD